MDVHSSVTRFMNEGVHVLHKCQATQNLILVTSLYKVAKCVYFTRPFGDVVFKKCIPKKKFHFLLNQGYIIICPWKNIVDDFIFNFSL